MRFVISLCVVLFLAALSSPVAAVQPDDEKKKKSLKSRFTDPEDGKFDLTAASDEGAGFFPIVLPFNEPATGPGVAVGLAYFHGAEPMESQTSRGPKPPPTTTFGGGAYTENGSWAAVVGHQQVMHDGRIRVLGALLGASMNLKFYGVGGEASDGDNAVDFTIDVSALILQGKVQLGKSRFFMGGSYVFAGTDTTFDLGDLPLQGETDNAGITWLNEYDSRDTTFTPSGGIYGAVDLSWFAEALGGDFDYGAVQTKFRYYWPLAGKWVLGFRGDFDVVGDDAPFYALSYVKLRGIPVFRYLGNDVATVEFEPRYKINDRWSVLAFTGTGRAARELDELSSADKAYNYGAGFRYLLARKMGLGAGIDIARGPEDTVGYLTVGSAW